MFGFLRKNSARIVYGIVISFVATTFLGVVFFDGLSNQSGELPPVDSGQIMATIGNHVITPAMVQAQIQAMQSSLPETVTADMVDVIQLNALNRAVVKALLLEEGQSQGVKVQRRDVTMALHEIMENSGLLTKKALKQAIQQAGGDYKSFIRQIKQDIIVDRVRRGIVESVRVTDADKPLLETEYLIRGFRVSGSDGGETDREATFKKARTIRQTISDTASFSLAYKTLYPDAPSVPEFEWVSGSALAPSVARAVGVLIDNEISQPIRVSNEYTIIERKTTRTRRTPLTIESLQKAWEQGALRDYVNQIQGDRELVIRDPRFLAIQSKLTGNIEAAIQAYRAIISSNPSDPYAHIDIARLHLSEGEVELAEKELIKAQIKESLLSDVSIIPDIHVLLAGIYDTQQQVSKRNDQYDRMIRADVPRVVLDYLMEQLTKHGDTQRLTAVKKKIDALENDEGLKDQPSEENGK